MSWKGSGKQSDPIIIDSIKGLKQHIKFTHLDTFILIKDIEIGEIFLIKCKNITIDNCRIYYLKIIASHSVMIKNCSIVHGNLKYCRGSTFQNNILHPDSSAPYISEAGSKGGDSTMRYLQKLYFIPFLIVILISFFVLIFKNYVLGIGLLVSSSIFLSPIIDMEIKKRLVKKLDSNTFKNNITDELEDLCSKYEQFAI
ncbi:MAG: hypothetical protein ACFFBC_14945 [Promethearchaeota archaeon]